MALSNAWRWVARVGVLYALVGATFTLASFYDPLLSLLGEILVPDREPPTASVRMYAAVMGAVVLGLGATMFRVARSVDQGPVGVARGLRDGLLAWFLVDTTASLLHGSWQNSIFNVLSLAVGLPPLMVVARKRNVWTAPGLALVGAGTRASMRQAQRRRRPRRRRRPTTGRPLADSLLRLALPIHDLKSEHRRAERDEGEPKPTQVLRGSAASMHRLHREEAPKQREPDPQGLWRGPRRLGLSARRRAIRPFGERRARFSLAWLRHVPHLLFRRPVPSRPALASPRTGDRAAPKASAPC